MKFRLDKLLLMNNLATSRQKAQALIAAGQVLVNGQLADKAGSMFPADCRIEIKKDDPPYVSRGGLKLAAGLDHFNIDPSGYICADIGASTGGFTDCLLQRGAKKVYAIDVGYGQLAWQLRQDPRHGPRRAGAGRHDRHRRRPTAPVLARRSVDQRLG